MVGMGTASRTSRTSSSIGLQPFILQLSLRSSFLNPLGTVDMPADSKCRTGICDGSIVVAIGPEPR